MNKTDPNEDNVTFNPILHFVGFICTVVLGFLGMFWSVQIDFWLARHASAISSLQSGWTHYSTPDRMFGSPLGPALTLNPLLFLGGCILLGLFPSLILVQSLHRERLFLGRFAWLLLATVALWFVKFPMPGNWTLYYHFAVRY